MSKSPETRPSLLCGIRDAEDATAWNEFVDIYAPLVHAYGRKCGLQDADAADLAQVTLQSVARSISNFDYDPAQGTFRGWLFRITRNHFLKMSQANSRQPSGSGNSGIANILAQHPDDASLEDTWNAEYEKRLFDLALQKAKSEFQSTTWQAFQRSVLGNQKAGEVADELGISVGAVYIARTRVKARLRELVKQLDAS